MRRSHDCVTLKFRCHRKNTIYTYIGVKDGTLECSQYVSIDHFSFNIHLVYLFVSRGRGREGGGLTEGVGLSVVSTDVCQVTAWLS